MGTLRETVRLDLRYSSWATGKLLEACSGVSVADRKRNLGLSHGTILDTLYHVYVSERFWTKCLRAGKIPPLHEVGAPPGPSELSFEELQQSWPEVWSGLEQWLETISDDELAKPLLCEISLETSLPFPPWQVVRHFVNHATLHRGQVVGMLRGLGKQPPNLDLMSYLLK